MRDRLKRLQASRQLARFRLEECANACRAQRILLQDPRNLRPQNLSHFNALAGDRVGAAIYVRDERKLADEAAWINKQSRVRLTGAKKLDDSGHDKISAFRAITLFEKSFARSQSHRFDGHAQFGEGVGSKGVQDRYSLKNFNLIFH